VNPKRQSVPETGAYRIVALVLADLRKAERALTIVEEAAPDAERAAYLAELRAAIERLARLPPSTWLVHAHQRPPRNNAKTSATPSPTATTHSQSARPARDSLIRSAFGR
jgi:hypothetical protein